MGLLLGLTVEVLKFYPSVGPFPLEAELLGLHEMLGEVRGFSEAGSQERQE